MIMSFVVAPFGVIGALYLREYARQGVIVRIVRIAVNNLAGVPTIVFGVFGLGFFVYGVGGAIIALSAPADEVAETVVKATPLLRLLDQEFPGEGAS